jgi:hypothetical protein
MRNLRKEKSSFVFDLQKRDIPLSSEQRVDVSNESQLMQDFYRNEAHSG